VNSLLVGTWNLTADFQPNSHFFESKGSVSQKVIPVWPIWEKYNTVRRGAILTNGVTHTITPSAVRLLKKATQGNFKKVPNYQFGPNRGGNQSVLTFNSNDKVTIKFATPPTEPTLLYAYKFPPGQYVFNVDNIVLRARNVGIPDPKRPGHNKITTLSAKKPGGLRVLLVPGGNQSTFSGIIEIPAGVTTFTFKKRPGAPRPLYYSLAHRGGSHRKHL